MGGMSLSKKSLITQFLIKEETSRVCVLGAGEMGKFIAFCWYRCDKAKPNPEIAKHAVSMAKAFGKKEYIASSLWCLGTTYSYPGEFYATYDHAQEAYQLYNALLPGDRELQRLCC